MAGTNPKRAVFVTIVAIIVVVAVIYILERGRIEPPDLVFVPEGSIAADACGERKSVLTGICFAGSVSRSGCTQGCAITSIPNFDDLVITFPFTAAGTLVEEGTNQPIEGTEIRLVMPDHSQYVTNTDSNGRFRVQSQVDRRTTPANAGEEFVQHLGALVTLPEIRTVTITGHLTDEMRKSYTNLEFETVEVKNIRD